MNLENMNKLIKRIEAEKPQLCVMADYGRQTDCGTAHCVGGWVDVLMVGAGSDLILATSRRQRADWLGIAEYDLSDIETLGGSIGLGTFDNMKPELRKAAMVKLLTNFRDSGRVDWNAALIEVGAL